MRWRLVVAVVLSAPLLGGCAVILKTDTQAAQVVFDQALPGRYHVLWDQLADTSGVHLATVRPVGGSFPWLNVRYRPPSSLEGCPVGSECAEWLSEAVEAAEQAD